MSQHDQNEIQQVACPASLRTKLQAYRVGNGSEQHYRVVDARGEQYSFEPWQFFVLEKLPECDDFRRLAAAFRERFDRSLTAGEVNELFARVAKHKLFAGTAMDHPAISPFRKKEDVKVSAARRKPSFIFDETLDLSMPAAPIAKVAPVTPDVLEVLSIPTTTATANTAPAPPDVSEVVSIPTAAAASSAAPAPPGVSEVVGMDDARRHIVWKLFNPSRLSTLLDPLLRPLRHAIYLLPLVLIASLFVLARHFDPLVEDLLRPVLLKYLLASMFGVSLIVTAVKTLVAYNFRVAVTGFCIQLGVLPSFAARIEDGRTLLRHQLIWLHAAPLLTRMVLFGIGVLLWFGTRATNVVLGDVGLALAAISALSFFIAASPMIRDSAYHMISAYLGETHLRQRSRQAMRNRLRGGSYAKVDRDVLAAYSMATATYAIALIGIVLLVLRAVFDLHLPSFVLPALVLAGVVATGRMIKRFKEIGQAHERKEQFQRWRKDDLPRGEVETEGKAKLNALARYSLLAFAVMILVALFLPYGREVGGRIVVVPSEKQDVTSEVSGIIETIHFDGGERLTQGTVIGRLSVTEDAAQVKILTAKIAEQQAVIAELKSRPRPEEVDVAQRNLGTEETRVRFSKAELARMEKLYAEKTVSFEDLEDVRREQELDVKRVAEKRASLDLIKAGAPPDEIAAAEAKLQSWEEERQLHLEKIEKSVFYAPIEGTLVVTHLKQKVGSYFERGQPLAVVENTREVFVQIDVPEEEIGYVQAGAGVRVRMPTYSGNDIDGTVASISPTVTEGRSGRVLQVTALIDNPDGKLKSGMEGYAKISGDPLPVWKVLSMGAMRFFNIEAWSWLP